MPLIDPVTMSGAGTASQSRPSRPSLPIEILPTAFAGYYFHPVVLLAAFCLRFPALVAEPVPTLLGTLIPVAVAQTVYCIFCLPISGANPKVAKKAQKSKVGFAKNPNHGLLPAAKVSHVIISLLLTTASIPFLLLIQILLGAPLTTQLPHTLLSSAHLSLLAVYPLIYVHGIDGAKWLEIVSAQSPFDEVYGATIGAGVGAWLGAVPIPLDWDREWQQWPVTIIAGMYMGWAAGKLLGGWLVKGKRIEFD